MKMRKLSLVGLFIERFERLKRNNCINNSVASIVNLERSM